MRQTQAHGETSLSLRDLGTTVSQTLTPLRQGVSVWKKIDTDSNNCQKYVFKYTVKHAHIEMPGMGNFTLL